jgi:hypothetical protein
MSTKPKHTTLLHALACDLNSGAPGVEVFTEEVPLWCEERGTPIAQQLGSALHELSGKDLAAANKAITAMCAPVDEEQIAVADLIDLVRILRKALAAYCTAEAIPLVEAEAANSRLAHSLAPRDRLGLTI